MTKEELTDKLMHGYGSGLFWEEDWTKDELHILDLNPANLEYSDTFGKSFEFNPPALLHKHDPHFRGYLDVCPLRWETCIVFILEDFSPLLLKVFESVISKHKLNKNLRSHIHWVDEDHYDFRINLNDTAKGLETIYAFVKAIYQMNKTSVIPL